MPGTGRLLELFGGPSLSPAWSPTGAFCFPPRALWTKVDPGEIRAAWASRPAGGPRRDPLGIYVHIPPKAVSLGRRYIGCLEREADLLELPRTAPVETVYVGSGGPGSLAAFSPADIRAFTKWLAGRFRLVRVRQFTAEVDPSRLNAARARALAAGGVDRVAASRPAEGPGASGTRAAFVKGLRLCRAAGIARVHADLPPAELAAPDAFSVFEADSLAARASGPGEIPAGGKTLFKRGRRAESAAVNRQLADALNRNASVAGLGWGAVSRRRGRLTYSPAGTFRAYSRALLAGRSPAYEGTPLDPRSEMRACLVRLLEDVGAVSIADFRRSFGVEPEAAFPAEFAALIRKGRLALSRGRIAAVSDRPMERLLCSIPFYGRETLARLAGGFL